MWASTSLRALLAGLLVVSAVLCAVGSTVERHQHHDESPAATHAEGLEESSGESSVEGDTATDTPGESGVKVLGVNTESVGLEIAAVVASLALAAAALFLRRPLVWLVVVVFGVVFAVGDGPELAHINESNAGIAAIAAVLVALHLAIAGIAVVLLARRTGPGLAAPDTANKPLVVRRARLERWARSPELSRPA
jgi:hypothetical protein